MLAQKLILSYSSQILIQIFQIAASIIVARLAGPDVLGTIAFGMAYVTMFTFIADLGFGTAHIKLLSEGRDVSKCLGTYSVIKITLLTVYVFFVIGFFLVQKFIFNVTFESKEHIIVIFIFLVIQIITQIQSIAKTTFAAYTKQARSDLPELISSILTQVSRIILVILGFRVVALAVGNLVAILIVFPFFVYLFKDYKIGKFDHKILKDYWVIALPVMLTAFTSTVSSQIDKVLLQFYTNSTQLGIYTAGYRIGGFVLLISQSVGLLLYPVFSASVKNKEFERIKNYIMRFERFSYVIVMPFLILVTLFSKEVVLLLLGVKFLDSIQVMIVINVAMFFRVLTSPYASLLVGFGHFRKGLHIGIIHFIVFILLLLFFIHPDILALGGKGAALAILLSNILMYALYRIYTHSLIKKMDYSIMISFLSYGTINFVLFYVLLNFTIEYQIIYKITFGFIYLIITYISLYILKLVSKEDLNFILTALNLKSMKNYISNEIKSNQ